MIKKLIIANWKMNPQTEREVVTLARAEDKEGVIIAPPFPFLIPVKETLKKAMLGAQDVSANAKNSGASTGDVSAMMLKKIGVKYVIVGHSERRMYLGETDGMIAKKVNVSLEAGLRVILCIGETMQGTKQKAEAVLKKQLTEDLSLIQNSKFKTQNLLVAYEPVWAISTTPERKDAIPKDAELMAAYIKKQYAVQVLYGGSVDGRNAGGFLAQKNIDGLLVGGASLRPQEFLSIIKESKK